MQRGAIAQKQPLTHYLEPLQRYENV
jgi:hypothetical protein